MKKSLLDLLDMIGWKDTESWPDIIIHILDSNMIFIQIDPLRQQSNEVNKKKIQEYKAM